LRIQSPGSGELRIQILDQLGRSHFDDSLLDVSGEGEADVTVPGGLNDGLYFLQVNHGKQKTVQRLMIQN
jgi:hypothetical protein